MVLSGRKFKIGIVGIGFGQQAHLPAFRSDPRCEVVAICASRQEQADAVAARHGIAEAYSDWRRLIEAPHIDAISIATPPAVQAEIASAALEQGKAVFCEKPLAASEEQASRLLMQANQRRLPHMVDFEFPDIEAWQHTKAVLDSGSIGALRHLAVSWNVETYANRIGLDSWKTRLEEGGGVLCSFVSHSFHYVEWLLGKIRRLSARLVSAPGDRRTADSLAVICLELTSGSIVSLSVSSHAFMGHGHRLEFYGDRGTLVLDNSTADYVDGFQLQRATRESVCFETLVPATLSEGDGRIAVVSRVTRRFVDWLSTGAEQQPNFADGLRVQSLIERAKRSDRTGRWVDCPEYDPDQRSDLRPGGEDGT